MYAIDDLFDLRNVVGKKLEQLLDSRSLTKRSVCAGAGISRPTLDKILSGELTNKTNFEKHLSKLLSYLQLTPNELMGNVDHPYTRAVQLRQALNIDLERLSKISGIPLEECQKIEAGIDVPLSELRDIAAVLSTSVSALLGQYYFQPTCAFPEVTMYCDDDNLNSPGGFWGHFGVLLQGCDKFMWFPITDYTRNLIYQSQEMDYMAIPCMDNSVLLINNHAVLEMTLLDDFFDEPYNMDWDYDVSNGEIPPVIYEAFDDYMEYKGSDENPGSFNLSEKLIVAIDRMIAEYDIDPDKFSRELNAITIYFSNGTVRKHSLSMEDRNDITYAVTSIYEGNDLLDGRMVRFQTLDEADTFVNFQNVSMIKLPLAKIEKAIWRNHQDVMEDLE